MKESSKFLKFEKGQTLIEAVVAIAVAVMMLVALVTLVNANNRRATLSRQSTQASKLAQEGIELARNTRDVNDSVVTFFDGTGTDLTHCPAAGCMTFTQFFDVNIDETSGLFHPVYGREFHFHEPNNVDPNCKNNPSSWCLQLSVGGDGETVLNFRRYVYIADSGGKSKCNDTDGDGIDDISFSAVKQFTLVVTWESPVGPQERRAVTCISNI